MGIYIFTWQKLRAYLLADEADPTSDNDFGKNIIPAMLEAGEVMSAYRFEGYWKDVGTLDSLWDANMDMLAPGCWTRSGPSIAGPRPARRRFWAPTPTWATAPWPRAAASWAR